MKLQRSLVLLSKMGPSKGRGPLNTKRAPRLKKGCATPCLEGIQVGSFEFSFCVCLLASCQESVLDFDRCSCADEHGRFMVLPMKSNLCLGSK